MANFCNQCAKELGFPEGDFTYGNREKPLEPGFGYPELCESCGPCLVDHLGNCIDPQCLKKHGISVITDAIMAKYTETIESPEYINRRSQPGWQAELLPILQRIATEMCGDTFGFNITMLHDEISLVVHLIEHETSVDPIDKGFFALALLQDMHEGDEPEALNMLEEIEIALQYALDLKQTIIDMDKWVSKNEDMGLCERVEFDREVNNTRSYEIAKELTHVNKV
jgi:hypothetical protein